MSHGALVNECLLALSEAGALAWKNAVGKARAFDNPARVITYGLVGSADILGVHNGRGIAVEVKVGRDRLRPRQCAFRDAWQHAGGRWVEARSVADALTVLA
jgi:hypothetical protein